MKAIFVLVVPKLTYSTQASRLVGEQHEEIKKKKNRQGGGWVAGGMFLLPFFHPIFRAAPQQTERKEQK